MKRNPLGSLALRTVNALGIMTNLDDDVDVLRDYLAANFRESGIRIIGSEALFHAVK
jgi:hypothetical protein